MAEVWERLKRVYGDTDLNIVTIKSNLESLAPKAMQEHKRVQEVYEAVEVAVTQLKNLKAENHLKEDFGLMNKLVMKLPISEQTKYTDYITSTVVELDPSSRWDKFWAWLKQRHKSAVQTGLMVMRDKTSQAKSISGASKSGMTCNNCGGVGHFARSCPSKQKLSSPSVKVNIAVAKINTRAEYDRYLADTKKQVGNCPACKQAPHSYTRDFPFGRAEWPSNRLDTCPKFNGMNPRERGELVEKLKACYKCLCWKHQGDACFTKSKSNCNIVTSGTACGGIHHRLLHGSGVAFCHKVSIKVANTHFNGSCYEANNDDTAKPPDLSQPVLLEIQDISVHNVAAKVMFDKGSTAALVTHSFAVRAGLIGSKVAYWLVVVGHDRVLRHTTLYTFYMEDNNGTRHEIQAYGIDQISEDSVIMDLDGVRSVFPGAPQDVYKRPSGPIDILIGAMYTNIQPCGGENGFTRGRLRLV